MHHMPKRLLENANVTPANFMAMDPFFARDKGLVRSPFSLRFCWQGWQQANRPFLAWITESFR